MAVQSPGLLKNIAGPEARAQRTTKADCSPCQDGDLARQPIAEAVALRFQVVARLEIEPEAIPGPKETCQAQGGVRRDRALPRTISLIRPRRDADALGEAVLRDAQRPQEFVNEDFSRMHGWVLFRHNGSATNGNLRFQLHSRPCCATRSRVATDR